MRLLLPAAAVAALALAGCASTGGMTTASVDTTESITPIQNTPVASQNLPAIGQDGAVQVADNGDPALMPPQPGQMAPAPLTADGTMQPGMAGAPGQQVANADGSFVSLNSVGDVPDTPGRDLSDGLSIEKLLGGWTIVSGATQCRLNLTYTAKTGTDRYRASTPNCPLDGLTAVASWQLVGTQVQLFDEGGQMIASLILTGSRFIGTLSGGQSISMVG
jgi:hypothetical protein